MEGQVEICACGVGQNGRACQPESCQNGLISGLPNFQFFLFAPCYDVTCIFFHFCMLFFTPYMLFCMPYTHVYTCHCILIVIPLARAGLYHGGAIRCASPFSKIIHRELRCRRAVCPIGRLLPRGPSPRREAFGDRTRYK